jgi:hypothetical protein
MDHVEKLYYSCGYEPICVHCGEYLTENNDEDIYIYYMDKGILLGTKTLVLVIRHYIRELSGVFSVCHA